MLELFKKKTQKYEPEQTALRTIAVPELQSYLVKEYEHSKSLEQTIVEKDIAIEEARKTEQLYNASLVTIKAFDDRISDRDEEIKRLNVTIQRMRDVMAEKEDKINTAVINYNNLQRENERLLKRDKEVEKEIQQRVEKVEAECAEKLCKENDKGWVSSLDLAVRTVSEMTGTTISRKKVIELLNDLKEV